MKVKVAEFRQSINHAFRLLNADWNSCVGEKEKVYWFVQSFRLFSELHELECPRAKEDDLIQLERVQDHYASHCGKHHELWMKARAYRALSDAGIRNNKAQEIIKRCEASDIIAACNLSEVITDDGTRQQESLAANETLH